MDCLITAIDTANANGKENTITLEAGTYTLTTTDNDTDGPNGLPSVTGTLTIRGTEAATTIIERESGAPRFRLMHIAAAGILTLEGLTLQGGTAFRFGGGIFSKGTLTLLQSTLAHNTDIGGSSRGGGLYNDGGTVRMIDSTVTDNGASTHRAGRAAGGGVYTQGGVVSMLHSTLAGNTAMGHFDGEGGGLYNDGGTVTITKSTLARNTASFEAIPASGGLFNSSGMVTITNSRVAHNTGTGIGNRSGLVIIVNSTVAGNSGSSSGGGINNNMGCGDPPGMVTLTNSTVAGNNSTGPGGGIANSTGCGDPPGMVALLNTILALNTSSSSGPNCAGSITSLGTNLLGDLTDCTMTLLPTDLTGDPGLGPFTDDGTPGNGHFPLLATSQAIDAATDPACPPTDQLGQPRVGRCDIGAIEFAGESPTNVNALVTFAPLDATFTFTPDPAGCPEGYAGTFSFEARLTNTSESALTNLVVVVATLTNGNLLQNADVALGSVGAHVTVPPQDGFSDDVLSPHEVVDVPFIICLTEREPFTFVVDVLGVVEAGPETRARAARVTEWRAKGWALSPE